MYRFLYFIWLYGILFGTWLSGSYSLQKAYYRNSLDFQYSNWRLLIIKFYNSELLLSFHIIEMKEIIGIWFNKFLFCFNQEKDNEDDLELSLYCVTCGAELNQKGALRHMEKCFSKVCVHASHRNIWSFSNFIIIWVCWDQKLYKFMEMHTIKVDWKLHKYVICII